MASWSNSGSILGFLLGAGVVSALHLLSGDGKLMEWDWHTPFSLVLSPDVIGLYSHHVLDETLVSREHTVSMPYEKKNKASLHDLFRKHKCNSLICNGIVLATNATYYMLPTYLSSYSFHNLDYLENRGVLTVIMVMTRTLFAQPLIDWLSDKHDHRPFILTGSLSLLFFSWPPLCLPTANKSVLIFFGLLVLALSLNMLTGMMAAIPPALFPTPIRYSGLAVVFNISIALASLIPTIASFLVEITHNLHIPAFYLIIFGPFGPMVTELMYESTNKSLIGGKPPASGKAEAKGLLTEYHDRIEESTEAIDERIKELQYKREMLVTQHPYIDQYLCSEAKSEVV